MPRRLVAALLLALPACVTTPGDDAGPEADPLTASLLSGADDPMRRFTGTDNGLQLLKWLIDDDSAVFAGAVARYGRDDVLPADTEQMLRRNGFRFAAVPVRDLPALRDEIGAKALDVQGWHGQLPDWVALFTFPLSGRATTVAIDGRMRRFEGGMFSLDCRCWTMLMEDGPVLHTELMPVYRLRPRGPDFVRLLGGEPADPPVTFDALAMNLDLEAGTAYILTSERPDVDWSGNGGDPDDGGFGPDVAAPPTLGRLLLSTEGSSNPQRGVLVFLPRIPGEMFPR